MSEQETPTIGEFEIRIYVLVRDALAAGVRESDIQAGFEAAVETALYMLERRENVVPFRARV